MWFAFIATVVVGILLYKLFLSSRSFWRKHGVPEIDISPAVGILDILLGRKGLSEGDDYAYAKLKASNAKYCGIYDMGTPVLLVKDMELLKKVLIKDFDHFVDRRQFFTKDDGSLKKMLLSLQGDEWKGVRASVSPTFTTGKIRRMMDRFNEVGKEWVDDFTVKAKASESGSIKIDVLKAVNLYTLDVISNAAFGMNAGVIKNPESVFTKNANTLSEIRTIQYIKFALRIYFPKLCEFIGLQLVNMKALKYFENILEQGLRSRMNGETKRNDFLQLMVEAKKGELKAAGSDELSSFEKDAQIEIPLKKQYLTEDVMNAQSVAFFFAGFSTTSNFIAFALYSLSLHPKIQGKLRQEVGKISKDYGNYDYDDLNQLVYLDMVVCETLRKFPAVPRLTRVCKGYKDSESGLNIPKDTIVGIPVNAIHNDKDYYEHPEKFYPEHFSPDKKNARNAYAFMPFGMGKRNCIGMRFALIEVKSAIAHMIHSFLIEPTDKTPVPLQGKPAGFNLVPPTDLELKLTPICRK